MAAARPSDLAGFSFKNLVERATRTLALAEQLDQAGHYQGSYDEYSKWARIMSAVLSHSEFSSKQKARDADWSRYADVSEKFNSASQRMGELRNLLDSASHKSTQNGSNPEQQAGGPEEESATTNNRRSIAERMAALSNAGINTSPTTAYSHQQRSSVANINTNSHPQPSVEALNRPARKPLPRVNPDVQPAPAPSEPSTPPPQPKPLPTPPDPKDPRPASQPLERSAADEAEKAFHSHFPSVDALEQDFPSMPSVPTSTPGASNVAAASSSSRPSSAKSAHLDAGNFGSPLRRSPGVSSLSNPHQSGAPQAQVVPVASTSRAGQQPPSVAEDPPLPLNNAITPAALHSYLSTTQSPVLVIDVRPRPDFERAHLKPPNDRSGVVCIEPIALRHALDSTQLSKSLFDCPREEKEAFDARHGYSLIVVTDQSSTVMPSSASHAAMSTEAMFLFHLNQAIYVNEFRAPLNRPPVLLVGGMSAWGEAYGAKYAQGSLVDTTHRLHGGSSLRRGSLVHGPDSEAKRANRRAKVAEGEMYGMNIARNVGDVIGSPSAGSPYQGQGKDTQQEYFPRHAITTSSPPSNHLYGRNSIMMPPVAFPPTAMPKATPPPLSYSKPDLYASTSSQAASTSSSSSTSHQPLSPNSTYANSSSTSRPPINYPNIAPSSYQSQQATDLQRPPIAAQPNSFSRPSYPYESSPYDPRQQQQQQQQSSAPPPPQNRRLSQTGYNPGGLASLPQWMDGKIGVSGLKNLGNTCYMNSTIQCLSATLPFAKFFTSGMYRKHINMQNVLGTKGQLANTICQLFQVLWSEQYQFVSPVSFRDAICHFAPQFRGTEQHDSQEFLAFLLDGLHEDLNMVKVKPKPVEFTPEREEALETLPTNVASEKEWDIYLMRDNSLIVQWFQGQYRSRLQCLTCGKTSTTYNPFMYLSLPLPSKPSKVTLDQCLDAFVQEEILDKGDAWNCPNCKKPRKASKRLTIARLPPILLIHLKRFAFRGPFSERIDTNVHYPVYGLDLSRYLPSGSSGDKLYAGQGPATTADRALYDLYGISQHFGTLSSGHYTAMVRDRDQWDHVEDSRINPIDEADVRKATKSTYILFYRLRS